MPRFRLHIRIVHYVSYCLFALFAAVLLFVLFYNLEWRVEVAGVVQPERYIDIKTKVDGIIKNIYVSEGEQVAAGTLIARMEDPNIQINYDETKARYELVKKMTARLERLCQQQLIPRMDVEEKELELQLLEEKLGKLENYDIRAPMAGKILSQTELRLKKGNFINAGTVIAMIADTGEMVVKVQIHETKIAKIKPGQKAIITFTAYPQMVFNSLEGTVLKIEPLAKLGEPETYFEGYVKIKPAAAKRVRREIRLHPGMTAKVRITTRVCTILEYLITQKVEGA